MVGKFRLIFGNSQLFLTQMAEEAKTHVRENYDWEKIVDRLEDVYRAVSNRTGL